MKYLSAVQEASDEIFLLAILSCLYSLVLEFVLSLDFGFISWEASCLFEILISYSRSEGRNPSAGYFFVPLQFGSQICSEGPNTSFQQIVGDSFLVPYCLGLLLPFPLWPNQVLHVIGLIFSKKYIFIYLGM